MFTLIHKGQNKSPSIKD